MSQTYRGDDLTRWGTGKSSDLTAAEVNINFWDIIQRLLDLEALPDAAAAIDYFEVSGATFFVHMTDHTILGPYDLPVATFRDRGAWAVLTTYVTLDTFTINGGLYLVIFDHVSDATSFDAGANDGLGHDYYQLLIQTPGSSLPTGGAVGSLLKKTTIADYASTWGFADASEVTFNASTGSSLSSSDVGAALEELETLVATATGALVFDAADVTFTPITGSALALMTNVADALEELSTTKANAADVIGRQTIWIPATGMISRTTNGPSSGTVELTASDRAMIKTLDFDATTAEYAQFDIAFPKSWDLSFVYFVIYWSHAATTTNFGVTWELCSLAVGDGDTMANSFGTFTDVTDTGGATNTIYVSPESAAAQINGTPLDGDVVLFRINRVPSDSGDTLAIDARLHGVKLIYLTTAASDV